MADTEAQASPQGDSARQAATTARQAEDVEGTSAAPQDVEGTSAEEAGTSADFEEADREAQILMAEREIVSESVPGGLFGAVMVEVCITLPRARHSTAENRLYPLMLWGRFLWVFLLLLLCMGCFAKLSCMGCFAKLSLLNVSLASRNCHY